MRLEGKAILVLGGGQMPGETVGNGRAASIAFAREGARVLVADLHRERAEETAREIGAQGGRAEVLAADVTREEECAAAVARCVELFGRLDVLHYNVGIATGDAPPMHLERAGWERMLEVNTTGFFLSLKHALPVLRAQGGGTVIAISSIAALWTYGTTVAYKCSKAAMNALVQSTAVANARYGVRVNAILPGLMDTPIAIEATVAATGRSREEIRAERDAAVPLDVRGTAWDVAAAAVFLASDEARFITGVCLPVDGGQSARVG
jgi:NAD(P)-dependent dehydrogenase (short-subunit alcohol dehydrogenase family)